jgi:fructan beta-fructosidase
MKMNNQARLVSLILFTSPCAGTCFAAEDLLIADFEGSNYAGWKAEGTAFGTGPAKGSFPDQMKVDGFMGRGLVNSYLGGDGSVGKLISPPFTIERNFISFMIGGGQNDGQLGIRLRVDGKVVRLATGPNDRPGGSENLDWASWNVSEFKNKLAILEIFDEATGGWGHISVDNIMQSDTAKTAVPKERVITAMEPMLLLPIKNGGPKRVVKILVGGKELRHFDIELADSEPDWWAPLDLSLWKGEKVTIVTNALPFGSKALEQIKQAKELPDSVGLYKEALRGQLRFSSRVGWLNDPNGMVYSQGLYHLFYQHNPYGWAWGNMHWGHATSPDMVHWTEWPIAMYPQSAGDMVYSGSAVVDKNNTSGWNKGPNDLLVAAFTSTGRGECIRYSTNKGLTWTEYENNPVVKHKGEGRDPRLIWHEPSKQWVMTVWSQDDSIQVPSERGGIDFYTSKDLKKWTFQSRSGGWFECADLFELPLENGQKKWVLTAASSEYRIGTFDGKTFVPETPKLPGMQGRDYYAAQTFSHKPKGRTVQIGWFRTETPEMSFNQAMSLPSVLNLKTTPEGPRLTWTPAPELQSLRTQTHVLGAQNVAETDPNPLAGLSGELFEIDAEFEPGTANEVRFDVRGVPIVYNTQKSEISIGGFRAHAPLQGGKQRLALFVDRTGIDVFASDGLAFLPFNVNLKLDNRALSLAVTGGTAKFRRLDVYDLKSSWDKTK